MAKTKNRTRSSKKAHIGRHREKLVRDNDIRRAAGSAETKGKLLKALMAEKSKEREL